MKDKLLESRAGFVLTKWARRKRKIFGWGMVMSQKIEKANFSKKIYLQASGKVASGVALIMEARIRATEKRGLATWWRGLRGKERSQDGAMFEASGLLRLLTSKMKMLQNGRKIC